MGYMDGVGNSQIHERGNYIKHDGVVLTGNVVKTLLHNSRQKGDMFIVELAVTETNMPDEYPVGDKVTWCQKMTDQTVAFPAVKAWAVAASGLDVKRPGSSDAIDAALNQAIENPTKNAFVGQSMKWKTSVVKTKANTDFTRHDFFAVK